MNIDEQDKLVSEAMEDFQRVVLAERIKVMRKLYDLGFPYQKIADIYGFTRQRAQQLIKNGK